MGPQRDTIWLVKKERDEADGLQLLVGICLAMDCSAALEARPKKPKIGTDRLVYVAI